MQNTTVLATQKDFNPFTQALKARCDAEGEVLVRMRNGDFCKVVYRAANPEDFEDEAFHKKDHSAYWRPSGHSITSSSFDIVEMDDPVMKPEEDHADSREAALNDVLELRTQMAAEGWMSEDKVSTEGWGGAPGYSIWFKRYDWHDKRAMALIGTAATYHVHTSDPRKAFNAALRAADLARRAWEQFPDCPPSQTAQHTLASRLPLGRT
jgi:hypothetical protein